MLRKIDITEMRFFEGVGWVKVAALEAASSPGVAMKTYPLFSFLS